MISLEGQKRVDEASTRALERVHERWVAVKGDLFSGQCGYNVFGSLPKYRPKLVVIGENPGFGAADIGHGAHIQTNLPTSSYLDGETWALKDRLVEMFANAGLSPVLRDAVVTNFLFFKSASHSRDGDLRWMELPREVRAPLELFCLDELHDLLKVMEPEKIMVLGMGAFGKCVSDATMGALASDGRRWLIGMGTLWGVPTFGMMHPTGAFWAAEDRQRAAEWLRQHFRNASETSCL